VLFQSHSPDLVARDTNGRRDVFVYDRVTDATQRVSVGADSAQANGHTDRALISTDGRFVALTTSASNPRPPPRRDVNRRGDVYLHDRILGTTR
jgi:hypothetical protein